jgi:hypothetical protein
VKLGTSPSLIDVRVFMKTKLGIDRTDEEKLAAGV